MKKIFFSLLFLTSVFHFSIAQLPDSLAKKVDAIFSEYDKTNSPGFSLAILKDGQTIYKRAYGMSNMEYNLAISPSSIFHVASISKQFAAAAVVKLSLEGKLSLDDDIRKYIPEVPDFGHTITFNHLLHHTSGLRDQWSLQRLAGWRGGDLITENDVLEMLTRQKDLNFLPGEDYLYCNTGYTLLAVAVKNITGISLRAYADSVFFKPLGMSDTHFHSDHSEITPNRTSAYQKDENGIWKISIPVFDTYGATSLFTTVEDLAKWDESFYSKSIGGDNFVNAMQKVGILNDNTLQTYASGLIVQTYKGYGTVEHGGADAGYRAYFLRFPDEHFTVLLLANLANIDIKSQAYKVADIFLKESSLSKPEMAVSVESNVVEGWAGDYLSKDEARILKLEYRNGELRNGNRVLKPSTNSSFTEPLSFSTYTFSGDSLNSKLLLNTKGSKNTYFEKVKEKTLTAKELSEFEGEYFSPELDTKYQITANDSLLLVKIPRQDQEKLSPFVKDMFTSDNGISIHYSRDKRDKISGFYLTAGRVLNLYFKKQ